MTWVVTGASGHIGANLVRALVARGSLPRVVIHEDTRALEGLDLPRVRADLLDRASLVEAFRGADTVFHLAARISIAGGEGGWVHEVNVVGTRNVVSACLACGVRRLVHFSSIHAFSQRPLRQPLDETRPPVDPTKAYPYDRSKALGEREVLAGHQQGLEAVIVNPTAVIGPHDYKPSAMGGVLLDLYRRRLAGLVRGGFDWVDARDVAAGAIRAAEVGRPGERYLLAGHWLSMGDLALLVEAVTGSRAPRVAAPMWLARLAAPLALRAARLRGKRPRLTPESLAALRANRRIGAQKAARELGHAPRPLRETIADTFRWFAATGRLDAGESSGR